MGTGALSFGFGASGAARHACAWTGGVRFGIAFWMRAVAWASSNEWLIAGCCAGSDGASVCAQPARTIEEHRNKTHRFASNFVIQSAFEFAIISTQGSARTKRKH